MTVILAQSNAVQSGGWSRWLAVQAPDEGLAPELRLECSPLLEQAWPEACEIWLAVARDLSEQPGAALAHVPACAGNASDFGLMLAWSVVVARLAVESESILVVCDDPWLFRHLATLPGVRASKPPSLAWPWLRGVVRGWLARLRVSLTSARAALSCRAGAGRLPQGKPSLLVYGHPASRADGEDAYFGTFMSLAPALVRLLHVDCGVARAASLSGPATTALHGFGSVVTALGLWRLCWRPVASGPQRWLVRRAAAREGATGTPAMIAWQLHCQRRWLRAARPTRVFWPWENHAWERELVKECRILGIQTIGYQHATIGQMERNYHPGSNPAGADGLPDLILCAGSYTRDLLSGWGVPADRMIVAGAWRFQTPCRRLPVAGGHVFVALPAERQVAQEMIREIVPISKQGVSFWVREHPMTPVGFIPGSGMERAPGPLEGVEGVSAVFYAGTSVGLEAALMGLPVVRFRPSGRLANDVLPPSMKVPSAGSGEVGAVLARAMPVEPLATPLFAAIDVDLWRNLAGGEHG